MGRPLTPHAARRERFKCVAEWTGRMRDGHRQSTRMEGLFEHRGHNGRVCGRSIDKVAPQSCEGLVGTRAVNIERFRMKSGEVL